MNQTLVLASSSVYRKEILTRIGLTFSTGSPDINETPLENESPIELVQRLSVEKAKSLSSQFPDSLIIGSDQVADHDGLIVGKPRDHAHAVQQLEDASGSTVYLYTGIALYNAKSETVRVSVETVGVEFRELTDSQIQSYLATDKPYDCCGSVKVESLGITLLNKLSCNDPNAITGLPVIQLTNMLIKEGYQFGLS